MRGQPSEHGQLAPTEDGDTLAINPTATLDSDPHHLEGARGGHVIQDRERDEGASRRRDAAMLESSHRELNVLDPRHRLEGRL